MRIVFDHLPPAVNLNSRSHWAVRAAHAKKAFDQVVRAVEECELQLPLEPYSRLKLRYHFYLPDLHGRDLEVLVENAKPYVDALLVPRPKRRGLSIIVDDRMTCVFEARQTWELRRRRPGFYLELEPEDLTPMAV